MTLELEPWTNLIQVIKGKASMNYEHDRKECVHCVINHGSDERVGRHNTYNTLNNVTSFILNYYIICIIKFNLKCITLSC